MCRARGKAGKSGRILLNFRCFSALNVLCSSCTCVVGEFAALESFSVYFLYFDLFVAIFIGVVYFFYSGVVYFFYSVNRYT